MRLVLVTLVLISTIASAEALKLGFVDLQKALQTVDEGKLAKTKLEKDFGAMKTKLEKEQAALQKEFEEFEKKAAILSDKARGEKQADLQKRFMEFQRRAQESNQEIKKLEANLTEPILRSLKKVVDAIAKEQNFQLIFEKNESAVLYSSGGVDLTDDVIKRYNKK